MKTQLIRGLFLVCISAFIQTSCVKEGPQGPPGVKGTDGNANVIASDWISPTSWAGQTNDWYFDVASAAITQDIIDYGVILAYINVPNDLYSDGVRPLPAWAIGCNWDFIVHYQNSQGLIEFTSDATEVPGTNGYNFRFILIPSSATLSLKSGSINGLKKSDLQKMPYKDVCKLLGITE